MKTYTAPYPQKLSCLKGMMESARWAERSFRQIGLNNPADKYRNIRYRLYDWYLEIRERYFKELDAHFEVARDAGDWNLCGDIIELKIEWL